MKTEAFAKGLNSGGLAPSPTRTQPKTADTRCSACCRPATGRRLAKRPCTTLTGAMLFETPDGRIITEPAGNGSTGSPYQIEQPEQLAWLAAKANTDAARPGAERHIAGEI